MKQLVYKWNHISLILRIAIGLVIGIILALVCPKATAISILGDLFVGALKGIAPILVFILVASSLANAKGGDAAFFEAAEYQRIGISAQTDGSDQRVYDQSDTEHSTYQQKQQFSVIFENAKSVAGYGRKYQAQDSERGKIDDPFYNL